jgi:hypothetical protein
MNHLSRHPLDMPLPTVVIPGVQTQFMSFKGRGFQYMAQLFADKWTTP